MKIAHSLVMLLVALAITGCTTVSLLPRSQLRQSDDTIKSKLLSRTALGASEDDVVSYLRANELKPEPIWRGTIQPNDSYFQNTVPGNSSTRVVIGRFRNIFVTSVLARYIFDQDRRLVEIVVSKETDAL